MKLGALILAFQLFICLCGSHSAFGTAVVLPERFAGARVIIKNSAEYKSLAEQNRQLAKQLSEERLVHNDFAKRIGDEQRRQANEAKRLSEENARLRASSKRGFPIWNVLTLAVQFVTNPFAFIVSKVVQALVGIVVAIALCLAALWAFRRWRRRRAVRAAVLAEQTAALTSSTKAK